MTNLVIDIGNTFVKVAVFNQDKIIFSDQSSALSQKIIYQIKEKYHPQNLIISSVKEDLGLNIEELKNDFNYIRFDQFSLTPIQNNYKSKATLGLDRLAATIGAQHLYPKQNVLVIDAGTCITYDVINDKGDYNGGSISAGLEMRFKALHQFTSKLPLISFDESFDENYGNNTANSISSGVINGVLFEVEGFIQQQLKQHQNTKIILCGGNSAFFESRFKNSIFAHLILHEPNLVLIGLNTVVNYQHDHK
jgi:type III pantothenate kinase